MRGRSQPASPMDLLPIVTGVILCFAVTLGAVPGVDLWWQLAAGKLIWNTGSIPHTDPFSFTARGRPWIVHEWAADVLFYLVYAKLKPVWLVFLKTAVIGTALSLTLFLSLRRSGRHWLASTVVCFTALAGVYFWDVRPQMFTYLFLAALIILLDDFRTNNRTASLWLIPPLALVWANLHGGFIVGTLVMCSYLVGDLLDWVVREDENRSKSLLLVPTIAASLAASMVNPYGWSLLAYPFRLTAHPQVMHIIIEWFSPDFHDPGYRLFELLIVALLLGLAWRRTLVSTGDLLLIVVLLHMSLYSVRHIPLFLIAAAPIVSHSFSSALGEFGTHINTKTALNAASAVTAVLAAIGLLLPLRGKPLFERSIEAESFPKDAVAFIKRVKLSGRMWNEYRWGGYLIWHLPEHPVFIDGRAEVYYGGPFEDFIAIHRVQPNWQALLDKYEVKFALVDTWAVLARTMEVSPYWRKLYSDRVATVFLRTEYRPLLHRPAGPQPQYAPRSRPGNPPAFHH
ncbi:MAG: hypothetical protein ACP5R4_01105 [Armatimonadota bacterium]